MKKRTAYNCKDRPVAGDDPEGWQGVPDIKTLRRRLGLTQPEFAGAFNIPIGTLRDWEQKRRVPDSAAQSYLRVIWQAPRTVRRCLSDKSTAERSQIKLMML